MRPQNTNNTQHPTHHPQPNQLATQHINQIAQDQDSDDQGMNCPHCNKLMKTNNRAYHIKKCSAYKPKPKKQASRITEGFWGWNAINGSTKTSKLPKKMGVKISKANRERKEVVRKDSQLKGLGNIQPIQGREVGNYNLKIRDQQNNAYRKYFQENHSDESYSNRQFDRDSQDEISQQEQQYRVQHGEDDRQQNQNVIQKIKEYMSKSKNTQPKMNEDQQIKLKNGNISKQDGSKMNSSLNPQKLSIIKNKNIKKQVIDLQQMKDQQEQKNKKKRKDTKMEESQDAQDIQQQKFKQKRSKLYHKQMENQLVKLRSMNKQLQKTIKLKDQQIKLLQMELKQYKKQKPKNRIKNRKTQTKSDSKPKKDQVNKEETTKNKVNSTNTPNSKNVTESMKKVKIETDYIMPSLQQRIQKYPSYHVAKYEQQQNSVHKRQAASPMFLMSNWLNGYTKIKQQQQQQDRHKEKQLNDRNKAKQNRQVSNNKEEPKQKNTNSQSEQNASNKKLKQTVLHFKKIQDIENSTLNMNESGDVKMNSNGKNNKTRQNDAKQGNRNMIMLMKTSARSNQIDDD